MMRKKLVVAADETRLGDFLYKQIPERFSVITVTNREDLLLHPDAAAVFILTDHSLDFFPLPDAIAGVPVFIHAMNESFDAKNLSGCIVRINAWPGFLRNSRLEISSPLADIKEAEDILEDLQWPYNRVADQPGMITPRVIAMIVNEACMAVQENVSSRDEIDIAMKLGTNYPFGPFEWADRIGALNIHSLLLRLSVSDKRYLPATEMLKILQSQA
jgi:3-hydroxybutyryl-CoA dehydrogenase